MLYEADIVFLQAKQTYTMFHNTKSQGTDISKHFFYNRHLLLKGLSAKLGPIIIRYKPSRFKSEILPLKIL